VRHLDAAGISWKAYEEDLPSVGYLGCSSGNYAARHDSFVYFSDVKNSSADQKNIVPFTQFATDVDTDSFPRYSFITPNVCNDAHDCALSVADAWLYTNNAPLLNTNMFQPGGDGVLIIVFDEGTDSTNGGGQIE
jgi:phospholipase C